MGGGMTTYVPGLCGLPFSSLLSSERARTATSSGVMLSKAPTFEGYILSYLYGSIFPAFRPDSGIFYIPFSFFIYNTDKF